MSDIIIKVEKYFGILGDGKKKTLEEARPTIDELIDPSVVYVTPKGEIYHDQLLEHIGLLLAQGATAELQQCLLHPKGVEYQVKTTVPGKRPMVVRSVATVTNGKFVRVEPQVNGYVYNELFGEPNTTPAERPNMISMVERYFSLWDGTRTFEEIKAVIEVAMDPDAIFVTPKGEITYEQYVKQCSELLEAGRKCDLDYVKPHPLGVEFKYDILMPGKEPVTVTSIGVVENGKLVRVEPQTNAHVYNELFGDPQSDIIKKVEQYFATLYNGEKKTLKEYKSTIDSLMDDNVVFLTPKGEIHHDQLLEHIGFLLAEGRKCELQYCKPHSKGKVEYQVKILNPGKESATVTSVATVENGKFVRVEPQVNGNIYNDVFGDPPQ